MTQQTRRWNPGDVANVFVRVILSDAGTMLGGLTESEWRKTLEWFDGRRAYTGEELAKGRTERDHDAHDRAVRRRRTRYRTLHHHERRDRGSSRREQIGVGRQCDVDGTFRSTVACSPAACSQTDIPGQIGNCRQSASARPSASFSAAALSSGWGQANLGFAVPPASASVSINNQLRRPFDAVVVADTRLAAGFRLDEEGSIRLELVVEVQPDRGVVQVQSAGRERGVGAEENLNGGLWASVTGGASRRCHVDDSLDQLRLPDVRPGGVSAFELASREPVTTLQAHQDTFSSASRSMNRLLRSCRSRSDRTRSENSSTDPSSLASARRSRSRWTARS